MEFNRFRCAAFIAPIIASLSASLAAQSFSTVPIKPGDLDPASTIAPETHVVDAVDAKIHAQLRDALDASARGIAASQATARLPLALRRGDQVLVEVRFVDGASDAVATLQRHGATRRHSLGNVLQEAWIPLSRVRELAAEPDVVVIKPARLARPLIGSKNRRGLAGDGHQPDVSQQQRIQRYRERRLRLPQRFRDVYTVTQRIRER